MTPAVLSDVMSVASRQVYSRLGFNIKTAAFSGCHFGNQCGCGEGGPAHGCSPEEVGHDKIRRDIATGCG